MSNVQSTFSALSPSGGKKITLTNVDSWLGCSIAVHLAETLDRKYPNVQIQALTCKDANSHLDKLKKFKNVHIHRVDYNDERSIEKAVSGSQCALLFPEMTDNRVKRARNVLTALKKERVRGCLMLSVEGAQNSENHGLKEIKTFHEIEKLVEEYSDNYMIIRKSVINQCFLLWGPVVQEKNEFPFTCTPECQMAPLDASDLVSAIETIVVEQCRRGDDDRGDHRDEAENVFGGVHKNKKYTLTGPHKITVQGLVQALSDETGQRVQFKQVSRDDLRKYFESLRKRKNWSEELSIDRCREMIDIAGENDLREDHDHHHMAPNESTINLMLDEFELIKKGEVGFVSGDLEKIIGRQGKSIKDFLRKNKEDFRNRN
ncbi:hypothetical protein EC991_008483 [Linnemannia zychae]|nr:hypothetical protein EC991_008483 [Linnemannia zychae]